MDVYWCYLCSLMGWFVYENSIFGIGWVMIVVYLIVDLLWNDKSGVERWYI